MLADSQLFFIWIGFTVSIFWLIPRELAKTRQLWLLLVSFIYVFAHASDAALSVVWMTFCACVAPNVFRIKSHAVVLWLLIILTCIPILGLRTIYLDAGLIATLGVTFATLRAVSLVIDSYSGSAHHTVLTKSLYMFFLPLYTVGPVDKPVKFNVDGVSTRFNLFAVLRGVSRTCLGLFKNVYVAEYLIKGYHLERFPLEARNYSEFSSLEALLFILLSFAYTYINFSAFVDIAIGISKAFGFSVMENFRFPIFAKNLQDFWKRWHISLGNWITNYLYLPIVFMIGTRYAPYLASFLAFSLIGWWHGSSFNYLLWGVLHGTGLCVVQFWTKWLKKNGKRKFTQNVPYILLSWSATILFVAWVQTIANMKNIDDAMRITEALFSI
jgi:D-alanyl-lipoteichoic acid acyltransferase DltB (MBOAT superfamily)